MGTVRFYPSEEGNVNEEGREYPDLPINSIRSELQNFLNTLKMLCHQKSWGLVIESLNHGQHMKGSMHKKGLAADINCYRLDPQSKKNMRLWVTFEEQGALIEEVSKAFVYDIWVWKDDLQTHTHFSIHKVPLKSGGDFVFFV